MITKKERSTKKTKKNLNECWRWKSKKERLFRRKSAADVEGCDVFQGYEELKSSSDVRLYIGPGGYVLLTALRRYCVISCSTLDSGKSIVLIQGHASGRFYQVVYNIAG